MCEKCNKIVKTCMTCIKVFYYFKCKYCSLYLCDNCAGKFDDCGEEFCTLYHTCFCCRQKKNNNRCLVCLDNKKRKCDKCDKKLTLCQECRTTYICSKECYQSYCQNTIEERIQNPLCSTFSRFLLITFFLDMEEVKY